MPAAWVANLLHALLILASTSATQNTTQTPYLPRVAPRSNVLLVVLDDFRPDLKVWGHEQAPETPAIDALAASSRVFLRAYSQFPDCAPSRVSFLTGLRPDRSGVNTHDCTVAHQSSSEGIRCEFRTTVPGAFSLPEYFRSAGYISLSYGKVVHPGLDDDMSWSSQLEFGDGYLRGGAQKERQWHYEEWLDPGRNTSTKPIEEHYGHVSDSAYQDHRTATAAIRSLNKLELEHKGKPWFMAVGFVRPHLPFVCKCVSFHDEFFLPLSLSLRLSLFHFLSIYLSCAHVVATNPVCLRRPEALLGQSNRPRGTTPSTWQGCLAWKYRDGYGFKRRIWRAEEVPPP